MKIPKILLSRMKDARWTVGHWRSRILTIGTRVRVNWFIPVNHRDYDRMPASVWIRCLQLIPYLEERGVHCTVNKPGVEADIAVFVRWQDEQAYQLARQQKQKGQRIVFDLCVNFFDETGLFEGGYGTTRERVTEAQRMGEVADVITCGSEFIRKRASEFHPRTVYLSESIDGRHFRFEKFPSDFNRPALTAVWSGQPSKSTELAALYPLLARRGISLIVISEKRPPLPGPYTCVPWSYYTFPHAILKGDLCVTPRRTDNPYDCGHSHFKIGVFMAQGVPALASPLPSYIEVIEKTGGGRICASESAWAAALDEVVKDRQMIEKWSQDAYRGMLSYSTESVVEKYIELFESLCATIP